MTNSYSFRQLLFFGVFIVGVLSLTSCAGGDDSSSRTIRTPGLPNFVLEFSPYDGGTYVYWSNRNTSATLESLNITSINITAIGYDSDGDEQVRETVILDSVAEIQQLTRVDADGNRGYDFTGLRSGLQYEFKLEITIEDGSPRSIGITPAEANKADYAEDERIGIGEDTDGDKIADFVDGDDDNDGLNDDKDSCLNSANSTFVSTSANDRDSDGCEDEVEDIDDDGDGLIEILRPSGTHLVRGASLEHIDNQLDGTALTNSTHTESASCGNGRDVQECSGYELINDITVTASNWPPLGNDMDSADGLCLGDGAFTTTFEGNGYTITLQDITSTDDCVGFFAQLKDAQIRNLTITAQNIRGTKNVGVLAGWGQTSTITNVHTRSMSLKGVQAVGGLIGRIQADNGTDAIEQVEASGAIPAIASEALPVIVAELATSPSIKDSSAKSNEILACASAGGLVGESDRIMIEDSYAINRRIELPLDESSEQALLGFSCDMIRSDGITHHVYKSIGGLVGDGDSSLWQGNQWGAAPNLEEHIVINIGDYIAFPNTDTVYPNDGTSTTTYGDLNLTKIIEGGTRIVSSYAISGSLTGNWKIAGLVGDLQHGEATNSFAVTKNIQARIRTAGGLIGQADDTDIVASYAIAGLIDANGSMTGTSNGDRANGEAGGLVGRAVVVVVNASYAISESILGGEDPNRGHLGSAAGLLGSRVLQKRDSDAEINIKLENSYASFDSIVGARINPLVGRDTLNNVSIRNSYWSVNATSVDLGETSSETERFYYIVGGENPNTGTYESLIGSNSGDPNIFSDWRTPDHCWDFGTDTQYPAIRCTPDQPADQRQWYSLMKIREAGGFIEVNTTSIDERIDSELN